MERGVVLCVATGLACGALSSSASAQCSPEIIGSYDTSYSAFDVAVSGTMAYVTVYPPHLLILDVSDPTGPALVSAHEMNGFGPERLGGAAASDTLVYVAHSVVDDSIPFGFYCYGYLSVVDVSDPTSPVTIGSSFASFDHLPALDLAVSGTLAYLVDGYEDLEHGFLGADLQVFDVSDPTSPSIIGVAHLPTMAYGVAVAGTQAYVANGDAGLQVFDVSDPTSPTIIGSADTPGFAVGVAVAGALALVTGSNALQVLDVSDPTSPAIIGSCAIPSAINVAVSGTRAYVVRGHSDPGLTVVDVSDPTNPAIVGSSDMPSSNDVVVSDMLAYIAGGEYGSVEPALTVVDVSSCAVPCPADITADGVVGTDDLIAVLGGWGTPAGDVTGDGMTDITDLLTVLSAWGPCA